MTDRDPRMTDRDPRMTDRAHHMTGPGSSHDRPGSSTKPSIPESVQAADSRIDIDPDEDILGLIHCRFVMCAMQIQ